MAQAPSCGAGLTTGTPVREEIGRRPGAQPREASSRRADRVHPGACDGDILRQRHPCAHVGRAWARKASQRLKIARRSATGAKEKPSRQGCQCRTRVRRDRRRADRRTRRDEPRDSVVSIETATPGRAPVRRPASISDLCRLRRHLRSWPLDGSGEPPQSTHVPFRPSNEG